MKLTLNIRKTVDENATEYFEKAKKSRKKIGGVETAISKYKEKLSDLKKKHEVKEKLVVVKKKKKVEWYEKFHWFITSDDFLVIGGRDATTNEIVIKKYSEKNDLVFHTDMRGSPFVVLKNPDGKKISEKTIEEATYFTAAFSQGWKKGMATLDVFHVKPDQVSKATETGGTLPKGSFMIYGKTKYFPSKMSYAIGIKDDKVMGGPLSAIKKHCKEFVEIVQGNEKTSDVAKLIKKKLGGDLDDIIRVLPAGCKVKIKR